MNRLFRSLAITFVAAVALATAAHAVVVEYRATLDGAQEVPPVLTAASGWGSFTIDTDANTLSYEISFVNLSSAETVAHIHGPAAPGATAGPKHTLPAGSPKIGVWNYSESDEADILAGLMYANVHSATNGNGEIRGQIVAADVPGIAPWGVAALAGLLIVPGAAVLVRRRVRA